LDGASSLNVAEERLVFGIHAHAMSLMTLAKIRKVYNKIDAKLVARQLGMSDHENATPIRIVHNSSAHLNGPARCIGAVLIGYLSQSPLITCLFLTCHSLICSTAVQMDQRINVLWQHARREREIHLPSTLQNKRLTVEIVQCQALAHQCWPPSAHTVG